MDEVFAQIKNIKADMLEVMKAHCKLQEQFVVVLKALKEDKQRIDIIEEQLDANK